jgi:hypothetical protein
LGFWKQLVDYELALTGKNSVKIIPSAIGYIPDIYENEVRSLVWAKQNPDSAGTLAALTPAPSYPTRITNKLTGMNNNNNSKSTTSRLGQPVSSLTDMQAASSPPNTSAHLLNRSSQGSSASQAIDNILVPKLATLSMPSSSSYDPVEAVGSADSSKNGKNYRLNQQLQQHQLHNQQQQQQQLKLDSNDMMASISKSNYTTTYQSSFQSRPRN